MSNTKINIYLLSKGAVVAETGEKQEVMDFLWKAVKKEMNVVILVRLIVIDMSQVYLEMDRSKK